MSEEANVETNDGTWSGLKKTIIGAISTAILAGGTYFTTHLFGGEDKEETKTEQAAPAAQPVINVNLENNNTNQQKQSGGTNTVIRERVVEKAPAEKKEEKKDETDSPW
jgi:hypothetical protein